ncbi:tetraprenyl-beta-curcumene synthase family protein [Ectobacillus ponti]|uniref:Tetraprenyl-beta-curcumene synthase family protein n=1 Tax=Ectobacillus ponti TaxID=2961894 RepID=A0AA41X640_9BACI|nr:tetraprenyl-beta-curcumene synthase family protein [Ectobacillus ponti]MCP8967520.1 tetraprenyl-beta-curcumene synthase family protein [Ectobacillus ponti]
MRVPTNPVSLMTKVYRGVKPLVHGELGRWKERAARIPNEELRRQALASIEHKTFHCEGGGILSLLAGREQEACVRFICAYQTISDYLDNLCDRSTSLDPVDFEALHESMLHALTPGAPLKHYYRFREEQDDGGYLAALVETCQEVLQQTKHYPKISAVLHELAAYYCDLQVHKHVQFEEREPRLQSWFNRHRINLPQMEWYEFSACAGSTLGIFCLVAYSFHQELSEEQIQKIREGYFPYMQGLHILLDYFIDQEEDRAGGDLNFCSYYENRAETLDRLKHFVTETDRSLEGLPHSRFHKLISRGLLGLYLSDRKVTEQAEMQEMAKRIVKYGGLTSYFFYINGKLYRKLG